MRRIEIGEIVQSRVARQTGATIAVERSGEGSWIENEAGYITLCLNHGTLCLHRTRALAVWHAVAPAGWCGDCASIAEGLRPKITRRIV